MNGLSSYPRSNGQSLPGPVAAALQRYVPERDRNTYSALYDAAHLPDFLDVNHADPYRQPGAESHDSQHPLPHPPLASVEAMLESDPFLSVEAVTLVDPLKALLRLDAENVNPVFKAFSGDVHLRVLSAGTVLYRIVGVVVPQTKSDLDRLRQGRFPVSNDPLGDWWVDELTLRSFRSEAEMRSSLALRTEWNGDHGVIKIVLSESVSIAYGPASSQYSSNQRKIFRGGGNQVYLPLRDLYPEVARHLAKTLNWLPMPWVWGNP